MAEAMPGLPHKIVAPSLPVKKGHHKERVKKYYYLGRRNKFG